MGNNNEAGRVCGSLLGLRIIGAQTARNKMSEAACVLKLLLVGTAVLLCNSSRWIGDGAYHVSSGLFARHNNELSHGSLQHYHDRYLPLKWVSHTRGGARVTSEGSSRDSKSGDIDGHSIPHGSPQIESALIANFPNRRERLVVLVDMQCIEPLQASWQQSSCVARLLDLACSRYICMYH